MSYDLQWGTDTITSGVSTGNDIEASLLNSFTITQTSLNDLDTRLTTNLASINILDTRVSDLETLGLPSVPSTDGTYQLTISNGTASWTAV